MATAVSATRSSKGADARRQRGHGKKFSGKTGEKLLQNHEKNEENHGKTMENPGKPVGKHGDAMGFPTHVIFSAKSGVSLVQYDGFVRQELFDADIHGLHGLRGGSIDVVAQVHPHRSL